MVTKCFSDSMQFLKIHARSSELDFNSVYYKAQQQGYQEAHIMYPTVWFYLYMLN